MVFLTPYRGRTYEVFLASIWEVWGFVYTLRLGFSFHFIKEAQGFLFPLYVIHGGFCTPIIMGGLRFSVHLIG